MLSFSELYIELFNPELHLTKQIHNFHDIFFWEGASSKPPSLMSRDFLPIFPVQFSFVFLLLVSCFYTLRPLQIVRLTSSCGAGRREIRRFVGGRVEGISPCVPSIILFPS